MINEKNELREYIQLLWKYQNMRKRKFWKVRYEELEKKNKRIALM